MPSTLYEEVAGIAIAELMSASEGRMPADRFEDAKHYAKQAFETMDAELPDLDPETDPPLSHSKRAAIVYVKGHLAGQEGSLSEAFTAAVNLYARNAIQQIREQEFQNETLIDEDARLDMFRK